MKTVIGCLSLTLLLSSVTRADLLAPGTKWFRHDIQIDNVKDHARSVFYVYPKHTDFGRAAAQAKQDESVAISDGNPLATRNGLHLYAIPREVYKEAGGKPQESWFNGTTPGVIKSTESFSPQRATRSTDPAERLVTHYRVTVEEKGLTWKHAGDKRYDKNNKELDEKPESGKKTSLLLGEPDEDQNDEPGSMRSRWLYVGIPMVALLLIGLTLFLRGKRSP